LEEEMKTASNPRGRRKGLIFAALTALAVILGLFMPGLAPLLGAQAADLEIDPDATNDLIVTKTFTGDIEASEIPENLVITLTFGKWRSPYNHQC
jgi:hypothetical protein